MEKVSDQQKTNPSRSFVTNNFKLWAGGLIFFLSFFHLYTIVAFPQTNIIPKEIILGIVLGLIVYLWMQELRDRHRVQALNEALRHAQQRLQEAEVATIAVLIRSAEAKDPYMYGHSYRVEQYALVIAKALGMTHEHQKIVQRSAILHDLGKIGISNDILNKPGKLNEEEWKIIQGHPQKAVDILQPLRFLEIEKKIILHHHERYEGGGYPGGIKGEAIPWESRIISIADTFDAMNSARPYRPALSRDFILAELQKICGTQLDPKLVPVFLRLLKEYPSLWQRDAHG